MATIMRKLHVGFSLFLLFTIIYAKQKAEPIDVNEENWRDILEGEWLIKFYAPWCPACRGLVPTWQKVASWSADLDIKVAHCDVTKNPGLSGRFLVTALPTIFHVKDGIFRQYKGARDEKDFISFVDDKRWEVIDPIPWWKSPNTVQMGSVGLFFKASMMIRTMHASMTEDYGVPVWGSYAIFAVLTIIVGLLLGLIIVFTCDILFPPRPVQSYAKTAAMKKKYDDIDDRTNQEGEESDIIEDDTKDDGSDDRPRKRQTKTVAD